MNGMLKRVIWVISFLIALSLTVGSFAADTNSEKKVNIPKYESLQDIPGKTTGNRDKHLQPLTGVDGARSTMSVGIVIGATYYDMQHNGSMGRMIAAGPRFVDNDSAIVHFGWMGLNQASYDDRYYAYNNYNSFMGMFNGVVTPHDVNDYGGYVNVDITPDNDPIVGGHNNQDAVLSYQPYFAYSYDTLIPGLFYDWGSSYIPDSVASYGTTPVQNVLWPKFAYQVGTDTVTHMIGQVSGGGPSAIYYFRKVGGKETGIWDYPPYVVDSIYTLSHDITVDYNGDKVALVWNANITNDPSCDTCSGESTVNVQWDNDVYYQVSNDQGQSWEPRVNITKGIHGEAGFRSYSDLSTLIDTDGDLHIIWSAIYWPANPNVDGWSDNCKLFHFSENYPTIRTIHDANYVSAICSPSGWNINISKMQISECDGKLYALWVQFNGHTNMDDCADGRTNGAANGELMLSISQNGGYSWDDARNLTNTYSPNCVATSETVSSCQNEHWPSMSQYGKAVSINEDWSGATIVDPSGSYNGDHYLDIMYIDDLDPGRISGDEGTWTMNPVRWFRLPCVEPIPTSPEIAFSWSEFGAPGNVNSGYELDTQLVVINTGGSALDYSITLEEDNGPTGWLAVSGFSGPIPSGVLNADTGLVILNYSGIVTEEITLIGRLIFVSTAASTPDTIPISLQVNAELSCCVGNTGDVNFDGGPLADISDLLFLVDFMFLPPGTAPVPDCTEEANIDGEGSLPDISDLLFLVDFMFLPPGSAPEPPPCP